MPFLTRLPTHARIILLLLIAIPIGSIAIDLYAPTGHAWFQRSGAFVILAGIYLEYLHVLGVWKDAIDEVKILPTVEDRIKLEGGVSLRREAEESVRTRNFVVALHRQISTRSVAEVVAVCLALLGTAISSYGDIIVGK